MRPGRLPTDDPAEQAARARLATRGAAVPETAGLTATLSGTALVSFTGPTDPFISTTDLSNILGRDVTADDGALLAVDAACDICRNIAECSFNAGTATVALDGTGTDALILPESPVTAAGTITVNGLAEPNFAVTRDGLLTRGTAGGFPRPVWPRGRQNIVVTYEHGYTPDQIPRDVRRVALNIAHRHVIQGIASNEAVGDVTIAYAVKDLISPYEEKILLNYRRPRT